MPAFPLAAALTFGSGFLNFLGSHTSNKKAQQAAERAALQARWDYDTNYLPRVDAANAERRQGIGTLLAMILSAAQSGSDIPEEWLVEAKEVLGPNYQAFEDLVEAESGVQKKGVYEEVERRFAGKQGLPGGAKEAAQEQALSAVMDAEIRAKAAGKVEHERLGQEASRANAENALRAGLGNLQARQAHRTATDASKLSMIASALGPIAQLSQPFVPQPMGTGQPQAFFQGPIAPSGMETAGNALTNSLMLYSLMSGRGGGTPGGGTNTFLNPINQLTYSGPSQSGSFWNTGQLPYRPPAKPLTLGGWR